MPRSITTTVLALATSLFVPAAIAQQQTNNARPGTINYVEGQATLNGQNIASQAAHSTVLAAGQTLATTNGKVEVLLTPGVFLRLADNSAVTMVSPDLTSTEVQVDSGTAELEVDQLYPQNDLRIDEGPAQIKVLKNGLYEFNPAASDMRVFDGEAAVSPAQDAPKWIKVKGHHELALNGEPAKSSDFNGKEVASEDPLYNWSKLRSNYLGQANLALAQQYAAENGGDYGYSGLYSGWMWDPGMFAYTWMPGDGLFWGPFGDGFYSPGYLFGGGLIYPGYGFRGGYFGGREIYRGGGTTGFRGGVSAGPRFGGGGFHGGGGMGGGGFHGGGGMGGGGFHGGGGGRR